MIRILLFLLLLPIANYAQPHIVILGVSQDGGHPHIGCQKKCCDAVWQNEKEKHFVVSLALVDPKQKKWWMFEATPDIKQQLQYFKQLTGGTYNYLPDGIFLTHAHIGHYTGLMQLGREALGAKGVTVYALPKMKAFLETNGPWSQLVKLNNINIQALQHNGVTGLSSEVKVKTYTVPHRDEYSETAGFTIITPKKKYLFIPDINKWGKWTKNIQDEVKAIDIALVDATFYNEEELPGRRMEEVPHPFVKETMTLFNDLPDGIKNRIYFIHMNHTNPLLWDEDTQKKVRSYGYNYAQQGMRL